MERLLGPPSPYLSPEDDSDTYTSIPTSDSLREDYSDSSSADSGLRSENS